MGVGRPFAGPRAALQAGEASRRYGPSQNALNRLYDHARPFNNEQEVTVVCSTYMCCIYNEQQVHVVYVTSGCCTSIHKKTQLNLLSALQNHEPPESHLFPFLMRDQNSTHILPLLNQEPSLLNPNISPSLHLPPCKSPTFMLTPPWSPEVQRQPDLNTRHEPRVSPAETHLSPCSPLP